MFLRCKKCGAKVAWELLKLGHLERNVYNCTNSKCPNSVLSYVPDNQPLPGWVHFQLQYQEAN